MSSPGMFLRAANCQHSDVTIFGIPYDAGVTNRDGTRFGPDALRKASVSITHGRVWPWNHDPFRVLSVVDRGDIVTTSVQSSDMMAAVEDFVYRLPGPGIPLALGGDHSVSLPILRALRRRLSRPPGLVHFDAHSDTWADESQHHGSVFYHALREGLIDAESSVQVGIRAFNADDHGLCILTAPWIHRYGAERAAKVILSRVSSHIPVYISIDIDVLDPAFAPGTGTPTPGGLTTFQMKELIYHLAEAPRTMAGMDLVEVSPPYDPSSATSIAGASLLLDLCCLLVAWRHGTGVPDDLQGGSGRHTWTG